MNCINANMRVWVYGCVCVCLCVCVPYHHKANSQKAFRTYNARLVRYDGRYVNIIKASTAQSTNECCNVMAIAIFNFTNLMKTKFNSK